MHPFCLQQGPMGHDCHSDPADAEAHASIRNTFRQSSPLSRGPSSLWGSHFGHPQGPLWTAKDPLNLPIDPRILLFCLYINDKKLGTWISLISQNEGPVGPFGSTRGPGWDSGRGDCPWRPSLGYVSGLSWAGGYENQNAKMLNLTFDLTLTWHMTV